MADRKRQTLEIHSGSATPESTPPEVKPTDKEVKPVPKDKKEG